MIVIRCDLAVRKSGFSGCLCGLGECRCYVGSELEFRVFWVMGCRQVCPVFFGVLCLSLQLPCEVGRNV